MRLERIPFRLFLQRYEGDPKKPDTLSFLIHTVDLKQPASFLKLGDMILGTRLKLQTFKYLSGPHGRPQDDDDADYSELTLVNIDTKQTFVLKIGPLIDIPIIREVPIK
ncbi:MAG: hypothetical protein ABJF10_03610 [Chthoniobacter sp.]|uniref:hypothetical protein n=1 Tax=Chthoniobacter sp. TaxID=2510640 RepID=UPI0032AD06E8